MNKKKAYKGEIRNKRPSNFINTVTNWLKFLFSIAVIAAVIGGAVWFFSNHGISGLLSAEKDEADTTLVEAEEEPIVEEAPTNKSQRKGKKSKKEKQYDNNNRNNDTPQQRQSAQVNVNSMWFNEGSSANVTMGSKLQLHLRIEPQGHNEPLEWSVASPHILGVNTNGLVTAISPGQSAVVVKAKRSGNEAVILINVSE